MDLNVAHAFSPNQSSDVTLTLARDEHASGLDSSAQPFLSPTAEPDEECSQSRGLAHLHSEVEVVGNNENRIGDCRDELG